MRPNKGEKEMRFLLALLTIMLLVGCAPVKYDTGIPVIPIVDSDTQFVGTKGAIKQLIRYVDSDAGVVCYMAFNGRGVFCLSLSDTTLDR